MGTSSALERLLSLAHTLKLSVGFAETFYDVDVADDLTRLAAELRAAPARAPRTAAWFREWEITATRLRRGHGRTVKITPEWRVYILGLTLCGANDLLTQL